MTPAEIETEARRLQDAWDEALATTGDHGAAGLAIAEASLRAREEMRERAAAEARDDHERLAEAHARITALPEEKRREAMRRLSRSYSAPRTCVEHDGCRIEGGEMVWPDGERWPMRTDLR